MRYNFVKSGQKELIINLYKTLKQNNPTITYVALIDSLSASTGIGKNTIKKTIAEYTRTGAVTSPNNKRRCLNVLDKISEADILGIRRKMHEFRKRREVLSLDKLLWAINNDDKLPTFSRATLYRLLKQMTELPDLQLDDSASASELSDSSDE